MKRTIIAIVALSLVVPGFPLAAPLPAQQPLQNPPATNSNSAPAAYPSPNQPALPATAATPAPAYRGQSNAAPQRRETRRQRRSYERETRGRRHSHISKGEKVFLVSIVGTSMGIGALAGGPKGLAIGAIVGGWGAYAGHKLWHWIR
jgi:hypothetical protein